MVVESKPSAVFWVFLVLVLLIIAAVAWIPSLAIAAQFLPAEQRLLASLVGAGLTPLLLLPKALSFVRTARWKVDLEGLESPVIARVRFSDVASVYRGYPRKESFAMTAFHTVIALGSRKVINEVLILRLADGRLVVLNLLSPAITSGHAVMSKVQEMLAGKPVVGYSSAEVAALKGRPMNKIVIPKNA